MSYTSKKNSVLYPTSSLWLKIHNLIATKKPLWNFCAIYFGCMAQVDVTRPLQMVAIFMAFHIRRAKSVKHLGSCSREETEDTREQS